MAEALGTVATILQLVDTALKAREYINDFHDAPKEQRKLFSEMEDLKLLLVELEKHAVGNPSSKVFQQMSGALTTFKATMVHFINKLGPIDRLSKFTKRLTWTLWSKKEVGSYLEELERIKALVNLWLTMDIWDVGQKQMSGQDTEKRQKILDWISPLNFLQRQTDVFSSLEPGTGEWLLADAGFQEWTAGSGTVLFCRGMPGAGKTVLASLVVDHLEAQAQSNNIGVACIYLNHKEIETQTIPNLFGGLWKQLVFGKPIPPAVHLLYDRHHERRTRPHLDEFFRALNSAIAEYPKVYFVIDALDEYPEHQRHRFLKHLGLLGSQINIMLTSRPHIHLDSTFPNMKILEIYATEDDIHRYLDMQIQNSVRLSTHIRARPELHSVILSKIVENCMGMFLLAKLHIESLATKNTIKAVQNTLQHLPKDLQHTYDEAMQRINCQNEEDKQLGLLALTWVANAKRPLSVPELREALAIEPDSTSFDVDNLLAMETILVVCAGLITIDETTSVVRLIHYTTQHYLDSIQMNQFPLAQTIIVSTCLTYLSFEEFEELSEFQGRDRDIFIAHPFLEYAQYCLMHAKGSTELDLQDRIISFLMQASRWHGLWHDAIPWNHERRALTPLCMSVACNLETIARYLLATGVSCEMKDFALCIASYYGHIHFVQLLLDHGANIKARDPEFGDPLQAASWLGHDLVVQLLIEKGGNVNVQGGDGGSALQAASSNGYDLLVQLLIEKGANVNTTGGAWGSSMEAASCNGHLSVVRLLIENGADVNIWGGSWASSLQAAAFNGYEQVVQLLIKNGADVNAQRGFYGNALQAASIYGHIQLVQLLIDNGANVNAQSGHFGNALQAASMNGCKQVAQVLIDHGANVNAQGGRYGNALQAASDEGHEQVVKLLLQNGANYYGNAMQTGLFQGHSPLSDQGVGVNTEGGYHGNALQAASYEGNKQVVQLLLENGADVNAQGGHHGNALQAASLSGHKQLVQFLIEEGANVNAQGGHYGNALQGAASQGLELLVQLLIEKGANVNAQGGFWGNALQAASARGYTNVVRLLLENGANSQTGQYGQYGSPLQAASAKGHKRVAQLLIHHGADIIAVKSYQPSYLHGFGIVE
ncbi:ankyrin repeat-containing domain protein [Mycena epipterygia]|nr:ankyrin repeat-containing domain protein [Mycena epipterygia]